MFAFGQPHKIWHILAASMILYAVLGSARVKAALSAKPVRFLGEMSFGLYLVHQPMLLTVFVPLFVLLHGSFVGMAALLIIFVIVSLLVGYLFTLVVDRPTIALIRRAKSHFAKRQIHESKALAKRATIMPIVTSQVDGPAANSCFREVLD